MNQFVSAVYSKLNRFEARAIANMIQSFCKATQINTYVKKNYIHANCFSNKLTSLSHIYIYILEHLVLFLFYYSHAIQCNIGFFFIKEQHIYILYTPNSGFFKFVKKYIFFV